jgi:hypothetical protein
LPVMAIGRQLLQAIKYTDITILISTKAVMAPGLFF